MKRMIRSALRVVLITVFGGMPMIGSTIALADVPAPIMLVNDGAKAESPPRKFFIEVLHKQRKVWAGTLRVGAKQSASYNQQMSQAMEQCSGSQARTGSFGTTSESLRASLISLPNHDGEGVRLMVQLEVPKQVCGAAGSDTIAVSRLVTVEPGKTVTIEGEGGLIVRVTRQ